MMNIWSQGPGYQPILINWKIQCKIVFVNNCNTNNCHCRLFVDNNTVQYYLQYLGLGYIIIKNSFSNSRCAGQGEWDKQNRTLVDKIQSNMNHPKVLCVWYYSCRGNECNRNGWRGRGRRELGETTQTTLGLAVCSLFRSFR